MSRLATCGYATGPSASVSVQQRAARVFAVSVELAALASLSDRRFVAVPFAGCVSSPPRRRYPSARHEEAMCDRLIKSSSSSSSSWPLRSLGFISPRSSPSGEATTIAVFVRLPRVESQSSLQVSFSTTRHARRWKTTRKFRLRDVDSLRRWMLVSQLCKSRLELEG